MTCEWIKTDRICIFGWTAHFKPAATRRLKSIKNWTNLGIYLMWQVWTSLQPCTRFRSIFHLMTNLEHLTLWLTAADQFYDEVFELADALLNGWLQTHHPRLFRAACQRVHIPNGLHSLGTHTTHSHIGDSLLGMLVLMKMYGGYNPWLYWPK